MINESLRNKIFTTSKNITKMLYKYAGQGVMRKTGMLIMCHGKSNKIRQTFWEITTICIQPSLLAEALFLEFADGVPVSEHQEKSLC